MKALTNLLSGIESVAGSAFNANEVIADLGDIEKATKAMAQTYCQLCRIHSIDIAMVAGAECLIEQNIADYEKANEWDW